MLESLFCKVAGLKACNVVKKRLQDRCFFREYSEIFKNTYFEKELQTAASETQLKNSKLLVKIILRKNMLSKRF